MFMPVYYVNSALVDALAHALSPPLAFSHNKVSLLHMQVDVFITKLIHASSMDLIHGLEDP